MCGRVELQLPRPDNYQTNRRHRCHIRLAMEKGINMKVLNIEASPRGSRSDSIHLATGFLEQCKMQLPALEIDTLNVWNAGLPDFCSETIGAKYKAVTNEE